MAVTGLVQWALHLCPVTFSKGNVHKHSLFSLFSLFRCTSVPLDNPQCFYAVVKWGYPKQASEVSHSPITSTVLTWHFLILYNSTTLFQINLSGIKQARPDQDKHVKILFHQVHSTLLASLVFISKEGSLSQVSFGLRAKALGWGPCCTKSPGIPAICL